MTGFFLSMIFSAAMRIMYERSIKTINSFNIYAEAEYWISRELKVKLGWNNDHAYCVSILISWSKDVFPE